MSSRSLHVVSGGVEKTRLLETRVLEGALDPAVREIAVRLVHAWPRNAHAARLECLHRFVRDVVDYHREPIETFQAAGVTLQQGGDCDCLVILLCSLAWSLGYPWVADPKGPADDPDHYSCLLGYPPTDAPHGEQWTHWVQCETSCAAKFGETPQAAGARRAPL